LWLGTQTNITKFENNKFTTITTFKDRAISKARVILEDESNRVWFGTESGLLYLEENEFHEVKNNNGDSLNVYSMDIFNGSLFVLEANKKIQQINLNNENDLKVEKKPIGFEKKNTIEVLWKIESSRGENFKKELYLQSSERILKYDSLKRKFITFLLKSNLVGLPKLQAFFPTGGENFLVGDNRLFFMENGKVIKELTVKEGLPEGEIVSIVNEPDKKENLWIGTSKGLVYYHDGKIIIFDQNDGLANDFCHFNSIAIDSEYVYIGTNDGISVVDRKKINKNEIAPNVHFTKLKTNKKIIKSNFQSETFEYDENTIQLDGASLSFIVPERTRYQFSKISESETEVFPLQNNATMTFFNLKPGKYRFTIQGTNNDDMMSTNQEEIQVEIKPAFWQTWYFITGVSLITLGFAYGVYSLRVYQIKQENIKLEKLVKQRTKELFAEKETSERLLLNVLPKNIAERLKKGESTIADSFHEVSVLFADIVGFTKLSQTISPQELVSRLNDLFTMFDKIALDLNVEKIKTIGDCYMAVAGLPLERADHAILIIEMAKKMLSAIEDFNLRHNASLSVRIGINTGEVVAGVIGKHKFIYDLWGDAVNTASRMESHGVPGRIHLSESTYKALKDKYDFESRGEMEIKGKGKMTTYLLNS
jgi:class 3 adenylate cyclase